MESFAGKLAVVTGGGSGMGRELVLQLAAEGCSVATCDLGLDAARETAELALKGAPDTVVVTAHRCDVSDRAALETFRDEVVAEHGRDHIDLLFNNAGIAGGGSFLTAPEEEWDRTFGVTWGGVYNTTRVFASLLVASDEGALVNTSSVNGFWAALGPGIPHTAYSAAKFAVKGFTEALLEDFRINAPHIQVAVVMPGHIGTNIVANTMRIQTGVGDPMIDAMSDQFRDNAPMSAAAAATRILDGVRANEWRILVGDDAARLDRAVRADPLAVYGADGLSLAGIVGAVEDVLGAEPAPG